MIPRLALSAPITLAAALAGAADLPAQLDWSQRVEIAAPVSGVVDSVAVRPGQRVAKGAPLLSLNQTLFKANLMEARADIERLTQEQADAERELGRANELYSRTVSSTTELDAAKLRHARARALLSAAEARAEKARRQLDESEPRAPFDAIVLDRYAEPGMAVAAQCQPTLLVSLARVDEILARASLSVGQAAAVKPADKAVVTVNGKVIEGQIAALRSKPDGRYQLDVAIPRSEDLLAGMQAGIRLSAP
jgi:RND family efflux transporter MFP subunit